MPENADPMSALVVGHTNGEHSGAAPVFDWRGVCVICEYGRRRVADYRASLAAEVRKHQIPPPRFLEDGRPNPNGYEGGWHDALNEILALIEPRAALTSEATE